MKVVKFLNPGESIVIGGQKLEQHTLTPEQAEALLKSMPELKEKIAVIEQPVVSMSEEEAEAAAKKKANKPGATAGTGS
jgi:hypothetical protein